MFLKGIIFVKYISTYKVDRIITFIPNAGSNFEILASRVLFHVKYITTYKVDSHINTFLTNAGSNYETMR